MPLMPRMKSKGERVAYAILGVPANMVKVRKTKREREISNRLNYEDSRLVR